MITIVNFSDFCDAFYKFEDRRDTFSYAGKLALFDYLEEYSENTGEHTVLDVIAFCCEFTEYDGIKEFQADYGADKFPTMEKIENATTVIALSGSEGFIIANF